MEGWALRDLAALYGSGTHCVFSESDIRPDAAAAQREGAAARAMDRVSGSISEPATPPSDRDDTEDLRLEKCRDARRESTPPPRHIFHNGHPQSPAPQQRPDSEDVAATLMALKGTKQAEQAEQAAASSSSPCSNPARKRSRNSRTDGSAPIEQPKRRSTGTASHQALMQPNPNRMLGPVNNDGVVAHLPIFTHGHNTLAQQPHALAHGWRQMTLAQPMVSSKSPRHCLPARYATMLICCCFPQLAFGGQTPNMLLQSMPASAGAATLPQGWLRSAFQSVDMSGRNLGVAMGTIGPTIFGPAAQHNQLQMPIGFNSIRLGQSASVPPREQSISGQIRGAAIPEYQPESTTMVCPMCQTGGNDTQCTEARQGQRPLQRRRRTMSRQRSK